MTYKSFDRFFTKTIPIARLTTFRFLFCLALVIYLLTHSFLIYSPYQSHYHPIPLFETLNIPLWDLTLNKVLYWGLIVCTLIAGWGVKTRSFLILSSVLYFLFLGHHLGSMRSPHSPYVWHSHNLNLYILMCLSCFPSVAKFSMGDLLKGVAAKRKGYYWEEVILILVICSAYFGSGYVKVLSAGLRWVDGYTLQAYLLQQYMLTDNQLALWLGSKFNLMIVISWMTILLEVLFIFGLLLKKARWGIICFTFGFHFIIMKSMGINFIYSHFLPYSMYFLSVALEKNDWYKNRALD